MENVNNIQNSDNKNGENKGAKLKNIGYGIAIVLIIIFAAVSYLFVFEGIIGLVFNAVMFLVITVIAAKFVKIMFNDFKLNKKLNRKSSFNEKIKNALMVLVALGFFVFGIYGEIRVVQDLVVGTKQETFTNYEVSKYLSSKGRTRYYVECVKSNGKEIRFRVNLDTYNKIGGGYSTTSKRPITVTYYENSKVLVDIK